MPTRRKRETMVGQFRKPTNKEIQQLLLEHSKKSVSIDFVESLRETIFFSNRKRNDKSCDWKHCNRIISSLSIRLMRYAQPEIIGICLAMSSLELPPYVLLWIIDWLPNYDRLSHHKKIHLIESVRNSIWKIKGNWTAKEQLRSINLVSRRRVHFVVRLRQFSQHDA
jgi:hypothetical protein